MKKSNGQTNGNNVLTWWRRSHRWLGISTAIFLLLLSISGIAINHSDDWRLDEKYVGWNLLLDAYGIAVPPVTASFSDRGHRVTQLGSRLYFDGRDLQREADTLTGMVVSAALVVVVTGHDVLLLTRDGEFVQSIELGEQLPAGIVRVGRAGERAVIESDGQYFRADGDVSAFAAWPSPDPAGIEWAAPTALPADQLDALRLDYRGRGLTVERVLLDLHSGRVLPVVGKALLDIIGVALIVLSATGLFLWTRRNGRRNGGNGRRH